MLYSLWPRTFAWMPLDLDYQTLPDYLAPNLRVVMIGINPSIYSVERGHYYANPRNRFWKAFNAAQLAAKPLFPETDHQALNEGIGFTDLVKRPTRSMSELRAPDYTEGSVLLKRKLLHYRPKTVCFSGLTAFAYYLRYAEGIKEKVHLGPQGQRIGESLVFVAPNPSPANASFSLETITRWYRDLKRLIDVTS